MVNSHSQSQRPGVRQRRQEVDRTANQGVATQIHSHHRFRSPPRGSSSKAHNVRRYGRASPTVHGKEDLQQELPPRNVEEQRIRTAAESLLGSSSSNHPLPSQESSLNTVLSEVIPPGDVVTGLRRGGRMSVVRRFFCLFVTFDLLFTILMWLICIMLISADVFKNMSEQIVHYNIHTSLFDIVMAAVARFVVLLLFYGLLYINHWYIIALSTGGTCSFLIAKVFMYNWVNANSPVLQVLLIMTSFVISWGEAWFLDFRVIPQEILAQDILRGHAGIQNERSPLLHPYLRALSVKYDDQPESVRNFYSPLDSLAGSDDDDDDNDDEHRRSLDKRNQELRKAREAMQAALHGLAASNWRREKETTLGDRVESRPRLTGGRIYRLEADLKIRPQRLLRVLFNELDSFPLWNPSFTLARRLEIVDTQTDISYQVMGESGGGLVSSRDYVTLRRWEKIGDSITIVMVSTTHSAAPRRSNPVRAEQGPSCWVMEPGSAPGYTHLRWLLDTELHGWVPQALLDQGFASGMLQWLTHLRNHIAALEPTPSSSSAATSATTNG